jgi:hypothetical protein
MGSRPPFGLRGQHAWQPSHHVREGVSLRNVLIDATSACLGHGDAAQPARGAKAVRPTAFPDDAPAR